MKKVATQNLKYSKNAICRMLGVSRQAFYKRQTVTLQRFLQEQSVLAVVKRLRRRQPKVGTRKLKRMLLAEGIHIGRDQLFNLLGAYKLLIKPRKKYATTTQSFHRFRKYPNLIRDLEITAPNQVLVADITYVETVEGFCYVALLTDVYSRCIVGYDVSQSLAIAGCQRALTMALKHVSDPQGLIHHSDRGIQYCSAGYVRMLENRGAKLSMTEESHVYENALAERVNGILKTEFMLGETLPSFAVAKELVREAIQIYNQERLHMSLNYETPAEWYRKAA